eukprot:SAG31_NODE_17546_length_667_cov_0.582746_1_plen_166_part_01
MLGCPGSNQDPASEVSEETCCQCSLTNSSDLNFSNTPSVNTGPFDTFFSTFWTMASMSTLDDWQLVSNLYRSSSALESGVQSRTTVVFMLFILVVPLTLVNILVTALVSSYIKLRAVARVAEMQKQAHETAAAAVFHTTSPGSHERGDLQPYFSASFGVKCTAILN